MGRKERLNPAVFDFPVQEFRRGYRSAIYFWRAKRILERDNHHPIVTLQAFQKNDKAILCGIDEALGVLKSATGYFIDYPRVYKLFDRYIEIKQEVRKYLYSGNYDYYLDLTAEKIEISQELDELWVDGFDAVVVKALYDGDEIKAWETVMTIEGDYSLFAHLESVYLGVLARRTRVATNTRRVVEAAGEKKVLFFADRFDHWATQGGDGYATHTGGAQGVPTDAMAAWYGERGLGTMPHGLIASYGGDTAMATRKFHQHIPQARSVSLVDFTNNCVEEALRSARELGDKLWAVRLDTAREMVDYSLGDLQQQGIDDLHGVVPPLVHRVRNALDAEGYDQVKIIVSGGFNPNKIRHFEELKVPVDFYAVGSWMLSGNFDFTADVVQLEGKPMAKEGRRYSPNPRLELVEY